MAKFQRILLRAIKTWSTSSYTTFVVFSAAYEGGSDLFCEGCLDSGQRGGS